MSHDYTMVFDKVNAQDNMVGLTVQLVRAAGFRVEAGSMMCRNQLETKKSCKGCEAMLGCFISTQVLDAYQILDAIIGDPTKSGKAAATLLATVLSVAKRYQELL